MDLTTLAAEESALNSGDTAWILVATALVLLMTPGVAFFYGGMVRAKSVLNMMMMSFVSIAIVSILWMLFGYSLAFTGTNPIIGTFDEVGLSGLLAMPDDAALPPMLFAAFQLMFGIITVALISGAIADRAKFGGWVLFSVLWASLVYFPVARWVFYFNGGDGGWIADKLQALDFAGGTAVHINAGAAALALTFVIGKRKGWPKERMRPHNLPFVLLGAGLLWFGWFGFNAGSAVAANNLASVAFMNTQIATAAAVLAWMGVEKLRDGHATTLGLASGAVAGLVAITPAAGSVDLWGALVIGAIAGGLCAFAVSLKFKLGFDDSLDVVGIHLVGGVVGSLLIGLFATATVTGGVEGLLYGGGLAQLGKQTVAVVAVLAYSFVMSFILGKIVDKTIGFRVSEDDESQGVDMTTHAETAYDFSQLGGGTFTGTSAPIQRRAADSGKVGA